jgi:hypothetical protein
VQAATGADLDTLGWIRFDARSQELVALPLEANIGAWRFRVGATDKGGESVEDMLELRVRQHSRDGSHTKIIMAKIYQPSSHSLGVFC